MAASNGSLATDTFLPGFLDNLAREEKILVISVIAFGFVFISTAIGCLVCVLSARSQKHHQSTLESQKSKRPIVGRELSFYSPPSQPSTLENGDDFRKQSKKQRRSPGLRRISLVRRSISSYSENFRHINSGRIAKSRRLSDPVPTISLTHSYYKLPAGAGVKRGQFPHPHYGGLPPMYPGPLVDQF